MKILTFIFFLIPFTLSGQARLSFSAGYGSYRMKELKAIEDDVPFYHLLGMKTVSSYPPYFNFEGSFTYQTNRALFCGVIIGYGSTGGRMDYGDYSGSVRIDQLAQYVSVNGSVGLSKKYPSKNMLVSLDLRPGVTITNFEMLFNYKIGTEEGNQKDEFKSLNVAIQPTVMLSKRIGRIGLDAFAGLNQSIARGKLREREDKRKHLQTASGQPLRADWGGYRIGLGVSCYLTD